MPTGRHHTGPGSGGSRRDNGRGRSEGNAGSGSGRGGRGRGSGKGFGAGPRGEPSGEFRKTWRDTLEGMGYNQKERAIFKEKIIDLFDKGEHGFEYDESVRGAFHQLIQKTIEFNEHERSPILAAETVIEYSQKKILYENELLERLLNEFENPKDLQAGFESEERLATIVQVHYNKYFKAELPRKKALEWAQEFYPDYKAFEQVIESILKEYDEAEGE